MSPYMGRRECARERDRERLKTAYKNRSHKLQPSLKWHMMKTWSCVLGESSRGLAYCTYCMMVTQYTNVLKFASFLISVSLLPS